MKKPQFRGEGSGFNAQSHWRQKLGFMTFFFFSFSKSVVNWRLPLPAQGSEFCFGRSDLCLSLRDSGVALG